MKWRIVVALALAAGVLAGVPAEARLSAARDTTVPPRCSTPISGPSKVGASGSGLVLGDLSGVEGPTGGSVAGTVKTAVANIPNRTSSAGFTSSMRTLAADEPDFMFLNEVSGRTLPALRTAAPGYNAYRDPQRDTTRGGVQSMNNVVMWRTDRWRALDSGRVKVVNDDPGYHHKRPFTWDRYATWALLQRTDGTVVSIVSTHMMTNPKKFPRQHGNPPITRIQRYARGMDIILDLVDALEVHGPVIVAGDMNSHPGDGRWTAHAKMTGAGFGYAKDRGVMYMFHPPGTVKVGARELPIASDHPALISTVDMAGQAGTGTPDPSHPALGRGTRPLWLQLPSGATIRTEAVRHAVTIIERGGAADLPRRAWVIALMAALAESGLRNVTTGDALGLFRQYVGSGWGTADELVDPARAADAFFGVHPDVDRPGLTDLDWQSLGLREAAAAVQGYPFPERYADRAADARYIVQQVAGGRLIAGSDYCGEVALGTCPDTPLDKLEASLTSAAATLLRCVEQAFPEITTYGARGPAVSCGSGSRMAGLEIMLPAGDPALGDRVAAYLEARGDLLDVSYVLWAGETWSPAERDAGWRPYQPRTGPTTDPVVLHHDRVHVVLKRGGC